MTTPPSLSGTGAADSGTSGGGQGRLAQVIATRGGLAAPEAPFVIEHREALIYMLCEAAELEHGIMCQYLFAAFSLKQSADEGLSADELAAVTRWRKQIAHVATQEMLHLALVHNLLSAIGAAPHLSRPNLPQPADHYPAGVQLALLPFGEQALRHFMFLERPEGMDLADADGLAALGRAAPLMNEQDIVPHGQDFATVGHLYRSIEAGIAHLADKYGERWLFAGPPRAQATREHFRWPELIPVTDTASASRAIEEILEQGEGPRGEWRDAHFGRFVEILDEYQQMRAANPGFDPVRPVIAANVRPPERDVEVALISDPVTAKVVDLFNVAYEVLLQMFGRFFAHTEETDLQLKILADATFGLMLRVIKPLGDLITTLPVGAGMPGRTAGPSFELFYESDYLMPHRQAAWTLLTERLDEASSLCQALRGDCGTEVASRLEPVLAGMHEIAATLAGQLPAESVQARQALQAPPLAAAERDALLARALDLAAGTPRSARAPDGLADLFDAVSSMATAPDSPLLTGGCDHAVARLVDSVMRPLATALTGRSAERDGAAAHVSQSATGSSGHQSAGDDGTQASQTAGELVWQVAETATELRVRLASAGTAPPELAEAVAALQDLACQLALPDERAARLATFWEAQRGLPVVIHAVRNGPYLATNVPRLLDHLGEPVRVPPQLALCRCGGSSMKPFCDGTHARIGFTDDKDPRRVPDRRDSYPGQQVTILDNRGTCQHSGLCTDRLATVFRAGQEPFVTPSGARMDEIIRAVRDCPSGALSLAVDGREARELTDWGNSRDAAIEITKDGPYRVTGGVVIAGADGNPVERNEGASAEHCALCRCGHSQNKPFCSGMHWYVNFRDPVLPAREPTLFEWAGGLPALSRLTRLLYDKYVAADPLLAPLFASAPPGEAARLAAWLGAVFGGPAYRGDDLGGYPMMIAQPLSPPATEDQRARWAELTGRAAREAGLPADPPFQAAFTSYIEWDTRRAAATQPSDDGQHAQLTAPAWAWGPAGPPDSLGASPDEEQAAPAELPGTDEAVSFGAHIKPLFRDSDRQSMSFAFDLWSHDDVASRASDILERLQNGTMPCDGAWAPEKIQVFRRWTESGMQP